MILGYGDQVQNKKLGLFSTIHNYIFRIIIHENEEMLEQKGHTNSGQIVREFDVLQRVVLQIFKKHKFCSFKIKLTRKIPDNDYDSRIKFCELLKERCNNQSRFLSILFSRINQFSI